MRPVCCLSGSFFDRLVRRVFLKCCINSVNRPMPFIPHTDADVRHMLDAIGVDTLDALFDRLVAVPAA